MSEKGVRKPAAAFVVLILVRSWEDVTCLRVFTCLLVPLLRVRIMFNVGRFCLGPTLL